MAAMEGLATMMLMMLMMQQGAGDALDIMSTQDYWKAQGVEQLSVDALAGQMKPKPDDTHQASAARKLMAIRALGELKKKEALPILEPLVKDPAPFVGEYARRAIAAIEGKPFERPDPDAEKFKADLALLPKGCGAVVQARVLPGGGAVSFAQVVATMKAFQPGRDEDVIRFRLTEQLTDLVGKTGNFRFEGGTMAVAEEIGQNKGFVLFIFRGRYDRDCMSALVKAAGGGERMEEDTVEGVKVWYAGRNAALAMPSDDRFIFLAGPNREALPVEEVLKSIKSGKGGLDEDKELAALVKSVDMSKPAWGVMKVSDAYREAPFLAPFDSLVAVVDYENGKSKATLTAKGKDEADVKTAVESFEKERQGAVDMFKRMADRREMAMFKQLVAMLEGIKTSQNGATATLTLEQPGSPLGAIGMMPLSIIAGQEERMQQYRNRANGGGNAPVMPDDGPDE